MMPLLVVCFAFWVVCGKNTGDWVQWRSGGGYVTESRGKQCGEEMELQGKAILHAQEKKEYRLSWIGKSKDKSRIIRKRRVVARSEC